MMKSKALSLTLSAALITSVAGLAGCGNMNDGNSTKTHNISTNDNGRIGDSRILNNGRNGMQHDLSNLKYSKVLSEKVSKINGVGDARVFVTKNNAYVSLSLDGESGMNGSRTGSNGMNGRMGGTSGMTDRMDSMTGRSNTGTNGRTDGLYGASGTGTAGLLRGMSDPRGTLDNNTGLGRSAGYGSYGTGGGNTMGDNSGDNHMMGSNGATMGNRGRYGAMSTDNDMGMGMGDNQVPQNIRSLINSTVQKTAPQCEQVYVSDDADFFDRSEGYAGNGMMGNGDQGDGNVVGNMTEDLGAFINRLFPMNMNGRDNGILNNDGTSNGMYNTGNSGTNR